MGPRKRRLSKLGSLLCFEPCPGGVLQPQPRNYSASWAKCPPKVSGPTRSRVIFVCGIVCGIDLDHLLRYGSRTARC